MKQKEFKQLKTQLEKNFAENARNRNVWYLVGYLTGGAGVGKERIYTETQLKELFDMVAY